MVQIRLGKITICQSGLNLLAGKGTRNGVAEVAPHLKEDGDGKGECDAVAVPVPVMTANAQPSTPEA